MPCEQGVVTRTKNKSIAFVCDTGFASRCCIKVFMSPLCGFRKLLRKEAFFMQKLKELYQHSLKEFCNTKTVVLCGILAALAIVLSMVASIQFGPYIRIGFSGLPNRIVEFLFGPVVGCLFGGALDFLKYIVKPDGPFFFGFTFNAMFSGLIYGTLLYRRPVSIKRIVIAEFIVKLVINCGLNTLWLSMLYGKGFIALIGPRIIKNIIMLPIDSIILLFTLTYAGKIAAKFGFFTMKTRSEECA